MTQVEAARAGQVTREVAEVARQEGLEPETIAAGIAAGTIVVPANPAHRALDPRGIGAGLRIKVNANLGTSSGQPALELEMQKLQAAMDAGADTVMDLSTGGDPDAVRRAMLDQCPLPLGTVPVYQAAIAAISSGGSIRAMNPDDLFAVIERHAADGVDFLTLHCGVTRAIVSYIEQSGRLTGIVSRGGAFLACWIKASDRENPLYEQFDRVLDIARRHDVTLSLGDGLRPGCLADATDRAQVEELVVLAELVERARAAGVQAMVEGPGHVPLDQVAANVILQKQVCKGAPFYVLGPLVTDVAPGYDHITSAIGGALAGMAGADFLCYVTPSEHLALPGPQEVRDGVIAARIAAHAADVVRLGARARAWDDAMARARRALDWPRQFELAIDPARARELHGRTGDVPAGTCTMCGDYCVFKLLTGVT
ncbi:MAG TPA: phosphomethylpyrimidine synthase ThiC [Armatimonadota bacterium]|nr:phosphomethylpyrimidine synthase ThiC [Armatimonadota bacterium]